MTTDLRRFLGSCSIIAAFVSGSCAESTPDAPFLSIALMETPAAEGSGEPFLFSDEEGVMMSWLEESDGGAYRLRFATFEGTAWSEPRTIVERDRFFVNWADFPSVSRTPDGGLIAHWLERGPAGGYDYGVRIVHSADAGRSWTEPWRPHEDETPTEHGFVSMVPVEGSTGLLWLDGRNYVDGPDGRAATEEMSLRFRTFTAGGAPGPETVVDARVCDCCQTDAALTSSGPIAVYRDRSPEEIRDIYVTRLVGGSWTEGIPVHEDGWEIAGCPVNGPAVSARADAVAVAWFTAAGDVPRVKLAFSGDAGRTFGDALTVDDGNPVGRVDVLLLNDGEALVSWIEQLEGERAAVRVRRMGQGGSPGRATTVVETSAARASGFPRMTPAPDSSILLAWTDASATNSRVRVARLNLEHP